MKSNLRPYFSFTKKERTGIVLLTCGCLFLFFLPDFFPRKELKLADITLSVGLQILEDEQKKVSRSPGTNSAEIKEALFPFNPNTIDAGEWMRLGLDEKLAQRIINYRNKGGRFYRAEDIKKIWGLQSEKAAALIPFVVLPKPAAKTTPVKKEVTVIDINTADTEDWKTLPGIGEVLSGRIIKYRNQSGGFARVEELQNVFGLTDSTLLLIKPYLHVHTATIPQLLLNRASVYQIVQKTGIPLGLAQAIVKKRQNEGNFNDWAELINIPGMSNTYLETLKKLFRIE